MIRVTKAQHLTRLTTHSLDALNANYVTFFKHYRRLPINESMTTFKVTEHFNVIRVLIIHAQTHGVIAGVHSANE